MTATQKTGMVRIRYADDETGWAELLKGRRLARIANIPLCGGLNLDDVVELRENTEGWLCVRRVIETPLTQKAAYYYDKAEDFKRFADEFLKHGGKVEGAIAPKNGEPGIFMAAFPKKVNPVKLASCLGIKITKVEDDKSV